MVPSFNLRPDLPSCITNGYNIKSACLVINPITVDNFTSLFNCTPVGRASDSRMGPKQILLIHLSWLGLDIVLSVAWPFGVQLVFFICSGISVVMFHTLGFSRCHNTFLSSAHL